MSELRREPTLDENSDASNFGAKLKTRLTIAALLVGLALAAIPLLDSWTGKKNNIADKGTGNIISATRFAMPTSAPVVSAPLTHASSQAANTAPPSPDLSQTPGMTAMGPLSLSPFANSPPATQPPPGDSTRMTRQLVTAPSLPHSVKPLAPLLHQGPETAAIPTPATMPNSMQIRETPHTTTTSARPAGSSVGYNVQIGLFNSMENAQKLVSELKSKGIDAQSETKVLLTPLRTRAEAEQAIIKLRTLGYAPLLNIPGTDP